MTVADLIKQLQSMPQDAIIKVWEPSDERYCTSGRWVDSVSVELRDGSVRIADW